MDSCVAAQDTPRPDKSYTEQPAQWGAIYAMTLCSFVLIASEFLPISLLSPIAETLHLSEGSAGQAIAVSGICAMLTSLLISKCTARFDRRTVLLTLAVTLMLSGTLVTFTPGYTLLMVGRALLGIAVGGFWSMSAAIAMRLVPMKDVPKALAVINGGNAIASTVAAPIGSLMGGMIGWRGAFFCVVPMALAATIWLAAALPKLTSKKTQKDGGILTLFHQRAVLLGLIAVMLFFMGQFCLFTYLRPFLEQVTHVSLRTLSAMLLIAGASGFAGSTVIGRLIGPRLHILLGTLPVIMASAACAMALLGKNSLIMASLLAIWGFIGTAAPVAWWTWVTRATPDNAEAGGGLVVAVIQLAITIGAAGGGMAYDALGPVPEFLCSGGILFLAAFIAFFCKTPQPQMRSIRRT